MRDCGNIPCLSYLVFVVPHLPSPFPGPWGTPLPNTPPCAPRGLPLLPSTAEFVSPGSVSVVAHAAPPGSAAFCSPPLRPEGPKAEDSVCGPGLYDVCHFCLTAELGL